MEGEKHEWERKYIIYCILQEIRKAKVKALYYSQLTAVHHGKSEPLVTFLQR
jgi:hypothetical protein